MRVRCLHGYFIFDETSVSQISDFMSLTGLKLIPKDNYFTFEALADAPLYTLQGKDFLGFKANITYEGTPWDVFKANEVIYDFTDQKIKSINQVSLRAPLIDAGSRYQSNGLILPGSTTDGGKVRDYLAWYSRNRGLGNWLYSEVTYV